MSAESSAASDSESAAGTKYRFNPFTMKMEAIPENSSSENEGILNGVIIGTKPNKKMAFQGPY